MESVVAWAWSDVSCERRGGGMNRQVMRDDSLLCVIMANLIMSGLFVFYGMLWTGERELSWTHTVCVCVNAEKHSQKNKKIK